MPVQTRARVPTDRVYSSPAAQQQVRFRPGKQNITYRRSLGASQRSRQQTLTQIDFVNLQDGFDQDIDRCINYDEEEQNKRRKRRRTDGDVPSSSSNFHTQTLTQLEFVSTPALRLEDSTEIQNNFDDDSTILKHESDISPFRQMAPPQTPSRQRIYEVPSSQSPFTPISARSQRFSDARSPLKTLDDNLQRQSLSPIRNPLSDKSPKLKVKIEDTFDYENESQQSRVPQTPGYRSSLTRSASSTVKSRVGTATQRLLRDEIRDSDEEDDDDTESYYDVKVQESQVESYYKTEHSSQINTLGASNNSPRDTQEADNQLQSTLLQFTQHNPYPGVETEDDGEKQNPFIRPSQATTVSQSQPATSSPVFLRRSNESLQLQEETFLDLQDGGRDQEQNDTGEGLPIMAIPDSPSQHPASSSSYHSPNIWRPRNHQNHQVLFKARQNRQQQMHVPPSTSYVSSSPPIRVARPRPIISSPAATTTSYPDTTNQNQYKSTSSPPPQPFSLLPSSQILMTRSQMLPDSLMNESVPPPPKLPFFIEDSETEEDFEE